MKQLSTFIAGLSALGLVLAFGLPTAQAEGPPAPLVSKKCMSCHKEYKERPDIVAGDFHSRSNKAKSIQINLGGQMQLVRYTRETTVRNVPNIKSLKKPIPVRISVVRKGNELVATEIVAKPRIKVPEDQLMKTAELEKLVAQGPEKGGYTLVDSRPGIKYEEGHIPTAISIPFPRMGKLKDRLPQDRNRLLVFYCGGLR